MKSFVIVNKTLINGLFKFPVLRNCITTNSPIFLVKGLKDSSGFQSVSDRKLNYEHNILITRGFRSLQLVRK